MTSVTQCTICSATLREEDVIPEGLEDAHEIHCPICGVYRITGIALRTPIKLDSTEKMLFSGYLRNHSSRKHPLKLTTDDINAIPEVIAPFKNIPIQQKIDDVLVDIYSRAKSLGNKIEVIYAEFAKYYLPSKDDFIEIIRHLRDLGYFGDKFDSASGAWMVRLTIKGWKRFEELNQKNKDSNAVFVAMSFDPEFKNIFDDAIRVACSHCGFDAFRVDSEEYNEKICDKIIAGIKKSRFLIADFTQNKHGVYFEAGYAMGMDIPIIWTCKECDIENLHFDTRQYNHIGWNNITDLKEKLIDRIEATIK